MHIHLSTYTANGKLSFCPPNHTTSTSEIKELLFLKTAEPSRVAFWYRAIERANQQKLNLQSCEYTTGTSCTYLEFVHGHTLSVTKKREQPHVLLVCFLDYTKYIHAQHAHLVCILTMTKALIIMLSSLKTHKKHPPSQSSDLVVYIARCTTTRT